MVDELTTMPRHRAHRAPARNKQVTNLLIWQLCALAGQVVAVHLARQDYRVAAELLSDVSLAAAYGRALWALTAAHMDRPTRNAAVVSLGVFPTLFWRATNPMLFTGFDEQLHMRTLGDILSAHHLFEANPLLDVSPRYPGMEAATVLVHQLGIPTMAAAFLVIIACRVVLVTVLCDIVESMTGSARAGGFAVAIYALSSQFVFFNSQFAYQTMALPLALSGVSFIVRARGAQNPLPFLGGATICLFATAATHHVTSFLTAGLLLLWALAEKGRVRLWITYGACAAVASTLVWAIFQRQLLSGYFGPIIDDVRSQFSGGERRELFKDSAGFASRSLDQYLLLYYAAALSLIVVAVLVLAYREGHYRLGPLILLTIQSASIPVLLAARVVPKGGELYDRFSSFLFLPFSLVVGGFIAWYWWREPHHFGFQEHRRAVMIRLVLVTLASAAFIGGYVLGSGASWARLPGPYMVAADTRSMDPEVLAAVKWARTALPAGSRITADRVGSELLAAQAGVWPVMDGPNDIGASDLYIAQTWGEVETAKAAAMRLRYLYVDRRLADELPRYGSYFIEGEAIQGQQLTDQQLTKFDAVPGMKVVYRHGPVSIYDISGLGIAELRSGWFGTTPRVSVETQLAVGLLCGVFVAFVLRSRIGQRIRDSAAQTRREWGRSLTGASLLAGTVLISVLMLVSGVWLTPLTIWSGVAVVVLANPTAITSWVRRAAHRITRRGLGIAVLLAVPLAVIVAASLYDAATDDIITVDQILSDPAAIHIAPQGTGK